jgi:hypothetical protein
LWDDIHSHHPTDRLPRRLVKPSRVHKTAAETLALIGEARRILLLFVLRPDDVPLPRTLCLLRYKAYEFLDIPTIGDDEFKTSLNLVGYDPDSVDDLNTWLSQPWNKRWIAEASTAEVAAALMEYGIGAKPVPPLWKGCLSKPAAVRGVEVTLMHDRGRWRFQVRRQLKANPSETTPGHGGPVRIEIQWEHPHARPGTTYVITLKSDDASFPPQEWPVSGSVTRRHKTVTANPYVCRYNAEVLRPGDYSVTVTAVRAGLKNKSSPIKVQVPSSGG